MKFVFKLQSRSTLPISNDPVGVAEYRTLSQFGSNSRDLGCGGFIKNVENRYVTVISPSGTSFQTKKVVTSLVI